MGGTVAIGECMIELRTGADPFDAAGLGWAGDVFNSALYLARLGQDVQFLTALGGDPFSAAMLEGWRDEGIGTDLVMRHGSRMPGLYAIRTDSAGERSFYYWRGQSAARALFDCDGIEAALDRAAQARCLYLSGITLSLYDAVGVARLIDLAAKVRARGGSVVFDSNYRPAGWPDRDSAARTIATLAPHVSVTLPTIEDEAALFGADDPADIAKRWHGWGAAEVVVKMGGRGAYVSAAGAAALVPALPATVVDTTGAGDSFNAAWLAARAAGADPFAAAQAGHRLAAAVIGTRGAILPRSAMPG